MSKDARISSWLLLVTVIGCHRQPATSAPPPVAAAANPVAPSRAPDAPAPPRAAAEPATAVIAGGVAVACSPGDWAPRQLPPLLAPGKVKSSTQPDNPGAPYQTLFTECADSPQGPSSAPSSTLTVGGVGIKVAERSDAGTSGRGWAGSQCSFDVWATDTTSKTTRLGPEQVPPFNTINAGVRLGSAVWLSVGFNGYTREFPKGGNRIVALDLCQGKVMWQSNDAISNGGLLLLGDYLISPFGFTSEKRFVYVLDAHSGAVIQKLPILENVCPSKSWAPNWHPGERCDAPGQLVGAANSPRVEGGLLFVDTNTGSSTFQFR